MKYLLVVWLASAAGCASSTGNAMLSGDVSFSATLSSAGNGLQSEDPKGAEVCDLDLHSDDGKRPSVDMLLTIAKGGLPAAPNGTLAFGGDAPFGAALVIFMPRPSGSYAFNKAPSGQLIVTQFDADRFAGRLSFGGNPHCIDECTAPPHVDVAVDFDVKNNGCTPPR